MENIPTRYFTIFSKTASNIESLEEWYKIIHNELNPILDATNFYIAFCNEKTGEIISPYYYDEKHEIKTPLKMRTNGITNYIINTKRSLYLDNDVREFLITTGKIADYTSKSKMMLGVPLMLGKKIMGTLAIRSYNEKVNYTHHHLEILEFVADQITAVIAQKRSEHKLEKSLKEKETILQELHHRTKNNMQVIISMLSIQSKSANSDFIKDKFQEVSNRISTRSLAQEKRHNSHDISGINLRE